MEKQFQITVNAKGAVIYQQDLDANNSPVSTPIQLEVSPNDERTLIMMFNYLMSVYNPAK